MNTHSTLTRLHCSVPQPMYDLREITALARKRFHSDFSSQKAKSIELNHHLTRESPLWATLYLSCRATSFQTHSSLP